MTSIAQHLDSRRFAQTSRTKTTGTGARRSGRILTGIVTAFLLFDAGIKFTHAKVVADAMAQLGYPSNLTVEIGVVLLACLTLYLIPYTAVLGAVLLTGYLGGAVATHVRVGDPLFSHVLFPVYVGAMLWGGLILRDARLRALFTFDITTTDARGLNA